MADLPIIFSGPMVRALLREVEHPGTGKTMTRRVLAPSNLRVWTGGLDHPGKYVKPDRDMMAAALNKARDFRMIDGTLTWVTDPAPHQVHAVMAQWLGKLTYAAGDRLWVRESCAAVEHADLIDCVRYEADGIWRPIEDSREAAERWVDLHHYHNSRGILVPPIHAPEWTSRLTLVVTAVKVEKLQAITRADAIAEGATSRPNCSGFRNADEGWSMDWKEPFTAHSLVTPIQAFGAFINELHDGRRWNLKPTNLWDRNPEVVAITFTVHATNIDQLRRAP